MKSYKKLIYAGLFSFFLFIFIYISFAYWEKLFSVLRIMLYASVISYVLVPAAEWLERYMPGTAAILLLFAALSVIIAVICILIVPPFINQVASLRCTSRNLSQELKAFSRTFNPGWKSRNKFCRSAKFEKAWIFCKNVY